ncbi:hypothetical protein Pla175_44970 [Pirellulimonas nuda]|uniref:Uncharacterized protein n=1 Tax=Pirellulimonas nuda TaxID=2528009 RepID=A0A518DHW6_9BACT|nr:hypothetical protein Pla175_44970 [Pirellulimonas nuda]
MLWNYPLSMLLLGVAGYLIDSHRRDWRASLQDAKLPDRKRRFARRQYLRRMQASSIIGVVGALVAVWPIVPRRPAWMAVYLALLVIACMWITLLGLVDAWSSSNRLRDEKAEAAARRAELLHQAGRYAPSDAAPHQAEGD